MDFQSHRNLPAHSKPDKGGQWHRFFQITDEQGRFSFRIPTTAKCLTIGYSGISEVEVTLTEDEQYNVSLSDSN